MRGRGLDWVVEGTSTSLEELLYAGEPGVNGGYIGRCILE